MNYFENNIYIQTAYQGVRNKSILNVNTSSDICTFDKPQFTMSGASKIPCDVTFSAITTGTSYVTIVDSTATTKDITFVFTGNTDSFSANNATFNYEIYKYNKNLNTFNKPEQYRSPEIEWSTFSGTSAFTDSISLTALKTDGEYLIKGNFIHNVCTQFANKLGYKYDTSSYVSGSEFGLYNPSSDFYMLIMKEASIPIFSNTVIGGSIGAIKQYTVIPSDGQTVFILSDAVGLDFMITLNGLTLSRDDDYSVVQFSGGTNPYIVTLIAETKSTDLLTFIYVTKGNEVLIKTDMIDVTSIPSGPTDSEGSSDIYYNTTKSKYEAYTSLTPRNGNDLLVMVNGVTLAFGIDFYQSISNPKRIIFEGTILVGDIIVIAYNANAAYVGSIDTSSPTIYWNVDTAPETTSGVFTLEFATDEAMTSVVSTGVALYVIGQTTFNATATISGTSGTELYYRVTNNKNYTTLCGDIISSTAYSDIIPIIITSNSINAY